MNLGEFIDTYRDAIAQRVVESYPPLYRPSEYGVRIPHLLRSPLGAQEDAIRGAALSLQAHRETTVVGEMGTGKTFIATASGPTWRASRESLVLCPPHPTRKWKREVEETVPTARTAIVTIHHRPGDAQTLRGFRPPLRRHVTGTGQTLLPVEAGGGAPVGPLPAEDWYGTRKRGNPSKFPAVQSATPR